MRKKATHALAHFSTSTLRDTSVHVLNMSLDALDASQRDAVESARYFLRAACYVRDIHTALDVRDALSASLDFTQRDSDAATDDAHATYVRNVARTLALALSASDALNDLAGNVTRVTVPAN